MCNVRDATGMAGRALSRWRALPLKLRGKIRVCVFASCAEALRSKLIGSAGRIAQYHDKSSNFEQAGTVVHLHLRRWRTTRAAERGNHLAST
jgi:hypothetical protein